MLNACTVNCSWFQRLLLPPLPIPALLYRITKEPKSIRKKDVIGITTKKDPYYGSNIRDKFLLDKLKR